MHEQGQNGESPFGAAKGEPERPLLEAFVVFLAFYLASWLSSGSSATSVFRPEFHMMVVATNLPRAILIIYLMAIGDGFQSFDIGRIKRIDLARAVVNGTRDADWDLVTALAAAHPWVLPSYGLHPWFLAERSPHWRERLEALAELRGETLENLTGQIAENFQRLFGP